MHGFNFCIGTAMEGLEDPANEICPIVAHFARRGKLFHTHFRNIRGGLRGFQVPRVVDLDCCRCHRL